MLVADGLTFSYRRAASPVLDGWSHAFAAGSLTAITGRSGSGKSTLLYLLGLMVPPTSGRVLVDGVDTTALPDSQRSSLRASRFGFVFQDAALDSSRTVLDNVTEAALYRGEPRATLARHARVLMRRFGIDVPPGRRPGQISGGQAQRIALVRALVVDPAILLADEPTGNLDPASARVVMDALQAHARAGACVVLVTHDPLLASQCDVRLTIGSAP